MVLFHLDRSTRVRSAKGPQSYAAIALAYIKLPPVDDHMFVCVTLRKPLFSRSLDHQKSPYTGRRRLP